MDTIVPVALPTATKFMQAMEARGIGNQQVLRALESIVVLNRVATEMNPVKVVLDFSSAFDRKAMERLMRHLFRGHIAHQRMMKRRANDEPEKCAWIAGETPEGLATTERVKELMDGLSDQHKAVVMHRSGLIGGEEVPVTLVAQRLGMTTKQVSHLRAQANAHIKARQRELYPFGRWVANGVAGLASQPSLTPDSPVESMRLRTRTLNVFSREGIDTVGDLLSKTWDELVDMRNLGLEQISQIELILASNNLRLRQD